MLIDTHGLFAGTHGGKLCFAHGVERAFSRWPDGIINGLTGGFPAVLREGIIPVTEDRRQGNNTFTRICGCGGFFLAVTAQAGCFCRARLARERRFTEESATITVSPVR